MKAIRNIVNGMLAGILISIGGSVFLGCFVCDSTIIGRTVGSFFFSTALLCICYKGYALYTGKIGYIFENHRKADISLLVWCLVGNIIATVPVGLALRCAIPDLGEAAEVLCNARLEQQEWWQTLVRAIFCGFLVYLAVSIFKEKNSTQAILLGIPAFILAGYEHSIADMFYFGASGILTLDSAIFIGLVVLGNSIGGMLLPLMGMIATPKPKKND